MEAYNLVYRQLINKGFEECYNSALEVFGVRYYQNNQLSVILQNWDRETTIEEIMDEARKFRDILVRSNTNVWNTYYILCCNHDVEDDTVFFIERDATALRKYLVRTTSDLDRIPFLDSVPVNKVEDPMSVIEDTDEYDKVVYKLLSFIKENNGGNSKLNQKMIEEAITTILEE